MSIHRREFLISALAMGACGGKNAPIPGSFSGASRAGLGHQVGHKPAEAPGDRRKVEVLIVGGGVAGLTAAWRLRRSGFSGSMVLLDLAQEIGGTAASRLGPHGEYPLGAHYITFPNREARHMHALLADVGVIQGRDSEGRPLFNSAAICLAPEERLFFGGRWWAGLWPQSLDGTPADQQYRSFLHACAWWTTAKGADGKWAFSIPVAHASADPEIRALAGISFGEWLTEQGYTDPMFRWWAEYGCRDDYGTSLAETSAWAGLHYHCARRPWVADSRDIGTHTLTWEGGNGALVSRLAKKTRVEIFLGMVAVSVDANAGTVVAMTGKEGVEWQAQHVILAVPNRVGARLLSTPSPVGAPQASPWLVANLHCHRLPHSVGSPYGWDNVIFRSESLGYVVNSHQRGNYGGPSTLTWFRPYCSPDPAGDRRALAGLDFWGVEDMVFTDLLPVHGDILDCVDRIDAHLWAHGTVRPTVGLHQGALLGNLARPRGRVSMAHTDLSGISLFEEASWHGVRAAEETLVALGHPLGESLL